MVSVEIDEDKLLDMLIERVEQWTHDKVALDLYGKMYESYVYGGCFDGMKLDIDFIVDNDCVNYCRVVYEGEDGYEKLLKVYEEQGLGDCSCEDCEADYIEAISEDKKAILIRYC